MKQQLHLYLITWNAARIPSVTSSFTDHILDGIPADTAAPDLLVLALQEASPLSYGFLGGSYFNHYVHGYATGIRGAAKAVLGEEYTLVGSNSVGMTAMLVFVRDVDVDRVKFVEYGGVGCGFWDMGNKAGVGVKVGYSVPDAEAPGEYGIVEMNFVSAHLAPHEWLVQRRNQDWEIITRRLVFEKALSAGPASSSDDSLTPLLNNNETELETSRALSTQYRGIYSPFAHAFVMGDLNYRTALSRPMPTDRKRFPQPTDAPEDSRHFSKLFEGDQCHHERTSRRTLQGFAEAGITFPPSYKYRVHKNAQYDANNWEWASRRWPSWTDRILYLPLPGQEDAGSAGDPSSEIGIVVHKYTSIPHIMDSDHKPVACYLSIPAKPMPVILNAVAPSASAAVSALKRDIRYNPPFPIDNDWKARRDAVRKREVAAGAAIWLVTTTTGISVLIGLVAGICSLWWFLAG